jgi:GntR family transcriptional regulator of vanillate catabolism
MSTRVEAVTLRLREMIVNRDLAPGSRVPERDLAEVFGVSRTPVRVALGILEAEGLVAGEANRGYIVSDFSVEDVLSAFDLRGVLEGFAARNAAERGLTQEARDQLEECVASGNALVSKGLCGADDMRRWSLTNETFHRTIVEAAGLRTLERTHAFLSRMPLVAPVAILFTRDKHDDAQSRMADAQNDHVHILNALKRGEGERADYLMREHAYRSREQLGHLLRSKTQSETQPKKKAKATSRKCA